MQDILKDTFLALDLGNIFPTLALSLGKLSDSILNFVIWILVGNLALESEGITTSD